MIEIALGDDHTSAFDQTVLDAGSVIDVLYAQGRCVVVSLPSQELTFAGVELTADEVRTAWPSLVNHEPSGHLLQIPTRDTLRVPCSGPGEHHADRNE